MVANVSLNGLTSGLKTVFLSVRSFNGFEEKIVVTVIELEFVCQTSAGIFLASISLSLRKK